MNMHRSIPLSLVGAVALALSGTASIAAAQTSPQAQTPPPAPPMPARPRVPPIPPAPPMPPRPAQPPMPPQTPPPPPQPAQPQVPLPPSASQPGQQSLSGQQSSGSAQFYPGTKSSATYPIQHGTLTVNAGMPAKVRSYGPPPAFATLDTNRDGRIGETEAQAYPPLDGDFLYASHGGRSISRGQYAKWVNGQH